MKRTGVLALLATALLVFTGCSLDVESFFQPPKVGGQQQAVQTALDTYLRDSGGAGVRYTLEYPVEGNHTAAFLLLDEQGYPVEDTETAYGAVAFYSLTTDPETVRVNRLQREGEEWVSVADVVGESPGIRQVAFGDLNGDGGAEMMIGWNTYSTMHYQLAVYATEEGLSTIPCEVSYTSLYVGDITAAGYDSLLLLSVGAGERTFAHLMQMTEKGLSVADTVALDGGIRRFVGMTLCRLSERVHGLFVDAVRWDEQMVTELIYYDDTGLNAPFYDTTANATTFTLRSGTTSVRDVDGDGVVEIPRHQLPHGVDAAAAGVTLTGWWGWDYVGRSWQKRADTLMNEADGYLVMLDAERWETVQVGYASDTRTLSLTNLQEGRPWLWLTTEESAPAPDEGLTRLTLYAAQGIDPGCYAWFDPAVIEAEKIRYMVIRLNEEGGR